MDSMSPPGDLAEAGSAFWSRVVGTWELDADDLALLEQACFTMDELARLTEAARLAEPMTQGSKGQPVVNGIFQEVRLHRLTLARLLKELALTEDEQEQDPAARFRSENARNAATSRWDAHRKLRPA